MRNASSLLIAFLTGITVSLLAVSLTTHVPTRRSVDFYADGSTVTLSGVISDDADRRVLVTNYTVDVRDMRRGTKSGTVTGRILATVRVGAPPFEYGDYVKVRGKLERPVNPEGFRYDAYLSRYGIYAVIKNASIERTGSNIGNPALLWLYRLRRGIESQINLLLSEPHASLLAGLLLGSRRGIPDSLNADFAATGLTHLVAISGYNITMLVTVIGTILFWLPLRWRFFPAIGLIVAFTLLTGATASAVRAAIMGILGLLALQTGRLQTTRLTVLWTAFLMLVWNPKVLWYDVGFQLSFLALIGVLELVPLIRPFLRRVPEHFGIQESLCLTLAAQMLASPWILFEFGQLSLIAPLSNLLAPPVVSYAMLLGLLSIVTGSLSMTLGRIAAAIVWLPLEWIIAVTHWLAALPFAMITMNASSVPWIVLYYAGIAGWIAGSEIIRRASSPPRAAPPHARRPASLGRPSAAEGGL